MSPLYRPYTLGNPLKLFLDEVPSSSADDTRALRGCLRGRFVYISFRFNAKKDLQRCCDVRVNILGANIV